MSVSSYKFLSNMGVLAALFILGVGVQAFISCTLNFPEENPSSNSNSGVINPSSSSSAQNQPSSSGSNSEISSSSLDVGLSSGGGASSSSNIVVSSSSGIISLSSSSISIPSSSSLASSSSSNCTAKDNTQTHYCYYFDGKGTLKEYGSMTDGAQSYKTVVIGTQTWMAENLNFTPSSGKSKCYAEGNGNGGDTWLAPDKPADQPKIKANCDKYGRLYDWATAKNACPSGWHLPDTSEWNKLRRFIEQEIFDNWEDEDFGWDVGTKLKAITGWKKSMDSTLWGVDSYGFGAIGSGYCVSCELLSDASGFYEGVESEAHWWTATGYVNQYTNDATEAYKSKITYNKKVMTLEHEKKADYLYSVRCIKN